MSLYGVSSTAYLMLTMASLIDGYDLLAKSSYSYPLSFIDRSPTRVMFLLVNTLFGQPGKRDSAGRDAPL